MTVMITQTRSNTNLNPNPDPDYGCFQLRFHYVFSCFLLGYQIGKIAFFTAISIILEKSFFAFLWLTKSLNIDGLVAIIRWLFDDCLKVWRWFDVYLRVLWRFFEGALTFCLRLLRRWTCTAYCHLRFGDHVTVIEVYYQLFDGYYQVFDSYYHLFNDYSQSCNNDYSWFNGPGQLFLDYYESLLEYLLIIYRLLPVIARM